ncbi:hypothetical protein LTR62_003813 [Meristemomyces frigidus]|uniref:CCHC-type domain-containing protein n=1 Tax=Meristemomyces frigidus TaxID=1508187 RepID=A0AAN7TIU6_9PEZI|nr:hypothetical protein LTR62_003813 [Meristemomyces frigidus]
MSWQIAAPAVETSFTPDVGFIAAVELTPDAGFAADGANDTFYGISEANISQHANDGACFRCGEQGHSKADCSNPAIEREFTGTCNACGAVGHRRAECPAAGPQLCRICKTEGHQQSECSVNRMIAAYNDMGIEDLSADDAWLKLQVADEEKDVTDIKAYMLSYAKAYPQITFEELEATFRDKNMHTYLIARKQEVASNHTIVNLQGVGDQEFVVSVQFTNKPRRAKFAEGWPESPEDNLHRLSKAGLPMDRYEQKCHNCNELGHTARSCSEEKNERQALGNECAVCNGSGHRARDCRAPRKTGKKSCRNCGSEEHIAKDCPEPRNPETDCTNERVIKCRNCDALDHLSRACPLPTDWSKVKCSTCHEFGHTYRRCTQAAPEKEEEAAGADGGW